MALLPLLSSGREDQAPRDGLGWLPELTCGSFPRSYLLGPALEHMSCVITHPSWHVEALFAKLGLSHIVDAVSSKESCRESYSHQQFVLREDLVYPS